VKRSGIVCFFIALLLILQVSVLKAADDKIKASSKESSKKSLADFSVFVDKSIITIGEKVKYTMQIEADESVNVEFPDDIQFGGFAVKDFGREPRKKAGKNRIREKAWYVLDTYTVGPYVIPIQTVKIKLPNGSRKKLKSTEIFVEVKSVIEEEGEEKEGLRDIKDPLSIPASIPVGIVIMLIALGVGGVFYWFNYKKNQDAKRLEPPLPAHERALNELQRIEGMGLIDQGQVKEFYFLVSNTLRKYLEDRFSLKAPEQTTEEFLENVSHSNDLEERYVELLKEYLYSCDLVKFARFVPGENEITTLLETTRHFIKETKPIETIIQSPVYEAKA
jgi:hypothetical protein